MYRYTWNNLLITPEERKVLDELRLINISNIKTDVQDVLCNSVY